MTEFSDILLSKLASATSVTILTGAGISAESGIPTFRDPDGLWQKFRPEELANVEAFLSNPVLVQGWYAHRAEVVYSSPPNAGHVALAEMETLFPDFTLITQNVDGLHEAAKSKRVLELHGSLKRNYCIDCGRFVSNQFSSEIAAGEPNVCPDCGGLIRPDVVWFGENLPEKILTKAHAASARADVFFSIGTSGVVFPAADLPLEAKRHGAYTVEINRAPSAISGYLDEVIEGMAGEILPRLVTKITQARTVRYV